MNIWFTFGGYMVSGLLIPFICIISNRSIKKPVFFILTPLLLTFIWNFMPLDYILPMYPGLLLSILLGFLLTKKLK